MAEINLYDTGTMQESTGPGNQSDLPIYTADEVEIHPALTTTQPATGANSNDLFNYLRSLEELKNLIWQILLALELRLTANTTTTTTTTTTNNTTSALNATLSTGHANIVGNETLETTTTPFQGNRSDISDTATTNTNSSFTTSLLVSLLTSNGTAAPTAAPANTSSSSSSSSSSPPPNSTSNSSTLSVSGGSSTTPVPGISYASPGANTSSSSVITSTGPQDISDAFDPVWQSLLEILRRLEIFLQTSNQNVASTDPINPANSSSSSSSSLTSVAPTSGSSISSNNSTAVANATGSSSPSTANPPQVLNITTLKYNSAPSATTAFPHGGSSSGNNSSTPGSSSSTTVAANHPSTSLSYDQDAKQLEELVIKILSLLESILRGSPPLRNHQNPTTNAPAVAANATSATPVHSNDSTAADTTRMPPVGNQTTSHPGPNLEPMKNPFWETLFRIWNDGSSATSHSSYIFVVPKSLTLCLLIGTILQSRF